MQPSWEPPEAEMSWPALSSIPSHCTSGCWQCPRERCQAPHTPSAGSGAASSHHLAGSSVPKVTCHCRGYSVPPRPELDDHWKLAVRWREAARGSKTLEQSSGLTGGADRDMRQPSCWTLAPHMVTWMLQRRLRLASRAVHPCDMLAGGPGPRSHMCEGMGRGRMHNLRLPAIPCSLPPSGLQHCRQSQGHELPAGSPLEVQDLVL